MGNRTSRLNRYYNNYEKTLESLQQDVGRLQTVKRQRQQRQASVSFWCQLATAGAVVVAALLIYQVRQQPVGALSYDLHFRLVGAALCLPFLVGALGWMVQLLHGTSMRRTDRKLKAIQDAQRKMVKELKDMCQFEKAKALIERFDPDAQVFFNSPGMQQPGRTKGRAPAGTLAAGPGRPGVGVMAPPMAVAAGAAASAVTGAGKALMPLLDKLATNLIADNPMLVEDLRRAQGQLVEAEQRVAAAVQESQALKSENEVLKARLADLEQQLGLPRSFPPPADPATPTAAAVATCDAAPATPAAADVPRGHGDLQQASQQPLELPGGGQPERT